MRTLFQPWLCYLALFGLASFSLISGATLEVGASSSAFAAREYLGNRPLPVLTQWFLALHTEHTHTLFTLSFYPTVIASAYLFFLFRRVHDEQERCARFTLVAFVSLTGIVSFLILGVTSLALPFLPISGQLLTRPEPPTPFLQQAIWIGLMILLFVSGFFLIALFLSARRSVRALR
jgi:hypothetical protein